MKRKHAFAGIVIVTLETVGIFMLWQTRPITDHNTTRPANTEAHSEPFLPRRKHKERVLRELPQSYIHWETFSPDRLIRIRGTFQWYGDNRD